MIQTVQDVKVAVGLSERLQTGLIRSSRQPLRNHSHLHLRISTTTQTPDQRTWSRLWSLKQTKKVCSARGHEVSTACLSRPQRVKPGAFRCALGYRHGNFWVNTEISCLSGSVGLAVFVSVRAEISEIDDGWLVDVCEAVFNCGV